jgi:hypothetical protein
MHQDAQLTAASMLRSPNGSACASAIPRARRPRRACCTRARDAQHLDGGVHSDDVRARLGQSDGGASRAGADVEHPPSGERRQRVEEQRALRLEEQRADGPLNRSASKPSATVVSASCA